MIHLELTSQEAQHLEEEVTRRLTEIDQEIAHTDAMDFRDQLKCQRESFRKFLDKLAAAQAVAA